MKANMHERITPLDTKPATPFRYPSRKIAPEGFNEVSQAYHPSRIHTQEVLKKPIEFTIETTSSGKYRATLRDGKISSTISFNASEEDLVRIQQELAEYIRDESPNLEACTIFLMTHVSKLDIKKALSEIPEATKYAQQGRSAMYIHEAYQGGTGEAQGSKAGRPRQDAHKLKIDIRPRSDIPSLIQAGFTRFNEIRTAAASTEAL